MRANLIVSVLVLCVCIVALNDHALAQKLYPVQGPMASGTPQPILVGHIRRPVFSSGPPFMLLKSWTLPNGEILQGKPKKVKATSADAQAAVPADLPRPNLAFAWDSVFGQGYFVAHILGKEFGQGVFTGDQGTVLQVETLNGQQGVAVDNKGNTFKMVW